MKARAPRLARWLTGIFPFLRGKPRVLAHDAISSRETWSARRVNRLSTGIGGANRYLEIGVQYGYTLEGVRIPQRVAVDPCPLFDLSRLPHGVSVHTQTSDDYFATLPPDIKFDIIFLDGLHQWFQTYRDIINAVNHLETGGVVLVDDVIPCDEVSALPSMHESYRIREETGSLERRWHGDVFKALFAIRDHHAEAVSFRVIRDLEGNSQALLWRCEPTYASLLELTASPAAYDQLTFEVAFQDGRIPKVFEPGSEDEILEQALMVVSQQRCS